MLWLRFKREFEEKMEEQMRKERAEATHRARAAAWEAEKAEGQANRVSAAHLCKSSGMMMIMCAAVLHASNKGRSMSSCLGSQAGKGAGEWDVPCPRVLQWLHAKQALHHDE